MDSQASLIRQLQNTKLSRDHRAELRCQLAKELEESGDHEAARRVMGELWQRIGEQPDIEGLERSTAAEVLLRAGVLTGWIGSCNQIEDAQETAKNLISEAIAIFESLGYLKKILEAQTELSLCYWRTGEYGEARIILQSVLARITVDSGLKARAILRSAIVEWGATKYSDALRILTDAAPLFEKINSHVLKGSYHNQIAMVCRSLATSEQQEEYLDRALIEYAAASFHFEQAGHRRYRANVENNLGFLFFKLASFKEAHEHLDRARQLAVSLKDRVHTARIDETRARVLLAQKRNAEAEKVARNAVIKLERGGHYSILAEALITYGTALARLGCYRQSLHAFQRAIEVAQQTGTLNRAGEAAITMIEELGENLIADERQADYKENVALIEEVQRYEHDLVKGALMKEQGSVTRAELVQKLSTPNPRLLCALIHKFDLNLEGPAPPIHGRFYVFVDECHRTQGGEMNKQMKRWLEHAVFIGFTGTPLLRKDKETTRKVFGTYIHTYKFHEAVNDKVVLDLKYEARDVPQRLTSQKAIDAWFEQKTKGLNNFQKAVVRKRWATMEELMSAAERKQRIIASIIEDFTLKPRLNNDRGTALLVADSIYDACHYFRLFQNTSFGPYCGIITSYVPNHNDISREPANSDERYKFDTYTQHVLRGGQTTKQYEDEMKRRFIEEPANCKLLIVVSKLLTGFDAPSCTYIYLDNEMHDHNLFQAICRTNRLDGDDKPYGHIVDYVGLFKEVQNSIAVYNSDELDVDESGDDGNVVVKDWRTEGKKQLDEAYESLRYLCEPVPPPREMEQYLRYFCGDASDPHALANTEPLRVSFYKATAVFLRDYAAIAGNLDEAGYSAAEIAALERETTFYADTRAAIKKHSGEELDIKPFEADMRHLINTYVQADPAAELGSLSHLTLTEMIIETGIHDAIARKLNAKGKLSNNAVAEGIINNVRKTIIRDQLTDPRFYAEMSKLLDDLIRQQREEAADYEKFLKDAEALVMRLVGKQPTANVPAGLHGKTEAIVLFNNLSSIPATTFRCPADDDERAALALELDLAMREHAPAGWKGDDTREKQVLNALFPLMSRDRTATQAIFEIIKEQRGY